MVGLNYKVFGPEPLQGAGPTAKAARQSKRFLARRVYIPV
jgi:hypothetical protein